MSRGSVARSWSLEDPRLRCQGLSLGLTRPAWFHSRQLRGPAWTFLPRAATQGCACLPRGLLCPLVLSEDLGEWPAFVTWLPGARSPLGLISPSGQHTASPRPDPRPHAGGDLSRRAGLTFRQHRSFHSVLFLLSPVPKGSSTSVWPSWTLSFFHCGRGPLSPPGPPAPPCHHRAPPVPTQAPTPPSFSHPGMQPGNGSSPPPSAGPSPCESPSTATITTPRPHVVVPGELGQNDTESQAPSRPPKSECLAVEPQQQQGQLGRVASR